MADTETKLADILSARPPETRHLLALLQSIQIAYKCLPKHALIAVAEYLNLPKAKVFSVATFYSALSLRPKGDTVIKVCCGTACHLQGAPDLLESLKEELGLEAGQTSSDGACTLETVNCLGVCALAPVVAVNELTYSRRTPATVKGLGQRPNPGAAAGEG